MIAKCLVVLVAVSQIGAFKYNQESDNYGKSEKSVHTNNFKYAYQPQPTTDRYQRIVGTTTVSKSPTQYVRQTPITRNVVVRGKYPVTLQNSGPAPDRKIPVVTSHVRTPVQEKPTVRLQTKIPAPKTIAHTCTCYKTIVKPRVQQHLITVPTIQRYIETMHRPVVENIHYEAYPVGCLESSNDASENRGKSEAYRFEESQDKKNSEVYELPAGFELPKTEKAQLIEIPRVQFVQSKRPQTVEIQRGIEFPRVQFVESRKSEEFEIPRSQFFDNKKAQIVEIPSGHFVENKPETVEMPRLEFLQAQKLQTVEIPRIQVAEPPKVQTVEIPQQRGTITLGGAPFTYQFKH